MERLADEGFQTRKRPRSVTPEPHGVPPAVGQRRSDVKRRQQRGDDIKYEDDPPLKIVALHRVVCDKLLREDGDHSHHEASALYNSGPQLFTGDNKASALRADAHLKIHDEERFLEDVDVVIYHTYACPKYQATVQDQFESFMPLELDRRVFRQNRAYFFGLHHDTEKARPENMNIRILSDEVHQAVSSAVSFDPDLAEQWDQERNLQYPFPFFFHHRQRLRATIQDLLDPRSGYLVNSLLSKVQHFCEAEYQEADSLFAAGLVNRRHFDKLFNNGEMIVTYQQGQPVAYRLNDVKSTREATVLQCSSWTFDGTFQRKSHDLIVRPPPNSKTGVPIASLEAFPLRFDEGLKTTLVARGRTFWGCRHRAHVLYLAPRPLFEAQTVGISLSPSQHRELWGRQEEADNVAIVPTSFYDRLRNISSLA